MQMLVLAAVLLSCSCVSSRAPPQATQVIARLNHPLAGARICAHDTEHLGFIEVNLESDWRDSTISVFIDDVAVLTFAGAHQDLDLGFPILGFHLLSADTSQQSLHSLRIEVFNELGEDMQSEIISDYHVITCQPPLNVSLAREALIVKPVRSVILFANGL
jgi:hypothetical protein